MPASAAGIILSNGRAETVVEGESWQRLSALPLHAAALVLGPGRQISVLAPRGGLLTAWNLTATARTHAVTWIRTQAMKVPIPFVSSS